MGAFTNAAEVAILNHLRGGTTYTPGQLSVALFTTLPNVETGSGGTEAAWTGYARQDVDFAAASSGNPTTIANDAPVEFGDPDADLTLAGFGVYDTAGPTLIIVQAFDTPVEVQAGVAETVSFATAALVVSLD